MKRILSVELAGKVLLILLGLLAVFHLFVLLGLVPPTFIRSGQLDDSTNLWLLETIAIGVIVLFMLITAAKTGYIRAGKFSAAIRIGMWIVFGYLLLNTVGNLASGVTTEKLIFTPITLILAFCALRLALEP